MTKDAPFKYVRTSAETIRLAIMIYLRFPLSLRNVEDLLRSYATVLKAIGAADLLQTGGWLNNRAGNSLLPFRRRERATQRFRRMQSLQKLVAVYALVFNHFNSERSLYSRANFRKNRTTALAEWRGLCSG